VKKTHKSQSGVSSLRERKGGKYILDNDRWKKSIRQHHHKGHKVWKLVVHLCGYTVPGRGENKREGNVSNLRNE